MEAEDNQALPQPGIPGHDAHMGIHASITAFLVRLWDHWYFLMGALLMIEPLVDYYVEGFRAWADHYVARKTRTRVAITLSIFAVLAGCFLAFRDEYNARLAAEAEISGTPSKPGYRPRADAAEQQSRTLHAEIGGPGGYKDQIAALQKQLGKTGDDLTFLQRQKPQVIVQTKEIPVVIPSGAVQMTPEEKTRIQKIRVGLSSLLNEGIQLSGKAITKGNPDPSSEANSWLGKTTEYLRANLDESYVTRLNDSSDIPYVTPSGPNVNGDVGRTNLWVGLHFRIVRLNQFITELSR